MSTFTNSMFESIKGALTKNNESSSSKAKDYLRCEVGNTYIVRLLPNVKDPTKTFFHYYSYYSLFLYIKILLKCQYSKYSKKIGVFETYS